MTTSLAGWMQYLTPGQIAGSPDAGALDFLRRLQQYDPSATIVPDSGSPESPQQGYHFVYDKAKLPSPTKFPGQGTPVGASTYETQGGKAGSGVNILNPSNVYDDPVYGQWTTSDNVKQQHSPLDTWGPIIPALAAGGAALAAGAAGGAGASAGATLGDMGGGFGGQFGASGLIPAEGGAGSALTTTLGDMGLGGGGELGADYDVFNNPGGLSDPSDVMSQPGYSGSGASDAGQSIRDVGAPTSGSNGSTLPGGPAQSALDKVLQQLGITNPGGGLNLGNLLNLVGPIASGILTSSATKNATNQVLAGIDKAGTQATSLLDANKDLWAPYANAGAGAMTSLQNMVGNSNLAGKYAPIPNSYLAGNFKPLGASRGLTLGQMAGGR